MDEGQRASLFVIIVYFVAAFVTYVAVRQIDVPYSGTHVVHTAARNGTGSLLAGPLDIYPRADNPGAINTAITQANIGQNICNPKWSTKSERPSSGYTTSLKKVQIKDEALPDTKTGDYEEDHLISLELGGDPKDPKNLWPEPYTASIADGGAKNKDSVENYLHAQVCAGVMTLAEAQKEIATDWYAVYVQNQEPQRGKFGSIRNADNNDPDDN